MFLDLHQLQRLHSFSIGAQMVLLVILYFVMDYPFSNEFGGRGFLLGLVLLFIAFLVTRQIASKREQQAVTITGSQQCWEHYAWTVFFRLAIQETANILALVIMWLTNNRWLMIPFLLGLLIFMQYRPTKQQYESLYNPEMGSEEE